MCKMTIITESWLKKFIKRQYFSSKIEASSITEDRNLGRTNLHLATIGLFTLILKFGELRDTRYNPLQLHDFDWHILNFYSIISSYFVLIFCLVSGCDCGFKYSITKFWGLRGSCIDSETLRCKSITAVAIISTHWCHVHRYTYPHPRYWFIYFSFVNRM